jgi:ankyrin repeat protein
MGARTVDKDKHGNNALCIASMVGHIDIVKILVEKQLEQGYNLSSIVNYQNLEGSTPVMLGSVAGYPAVVR